MPTRASLHADNLLRLREVVTSGLPSHRTVVLHGPEGMDLYDIVCALRDDFSEEQVLTVHGYCGGGTAQPFQPFAQMIQALALMPGLVPADRLEALMAGPLTDPQSASGVSEVLDQVRTRDRRLNHMEAIRQTLCDVARDRKLRLVVHALEHADEDTQSLLMYLLEDAASSQVGSLTGQPPDRPTYLLTLADDGPPGRDWLHRLHEADGTTFLRVEPLDAAGLGALAQEEASVSKLMQLTQGLPARFRELIGLLPDSLADLAEIRLATLSPEAQRVLRLARVLDCAVSLGALTVASGASRIVVQKLRSEGFLIDRYRDGTREVRLAELWARTPALLPTSEEERVELHRVCAQYLLTQVEANGDEGLCEDIVRHCLAAGEVGTASDYALRAVHWLREQGAWQRALQITHEMTRRGEQPADGLLLAQIDLEVGLGHYEDALSSCRKLGRQDSMALVLRTARIHTLTGSYRESAALLERLRGQSLTETVAEAVDVELAEAHLRCGDLEAATALCVARLKSMSSQATENGLQFRHVLGKIAFWRADWATAESTYHGLLEDLPTQSVHVQLRARVLHNLGLVGLRTGRHDFAARHIQSALGVLEGMGEYYEAAVCRHNLGIAQELAQRYAMAQELFEHSIEAFERFGNRANLAGAINSLGDLYLTLGEVWRARKLLQYSRQIAVEHGLDYFIAFNDLRLAAVEIAESRWEQAADCLAAAKQMFEAAGHRDEMSQAELLCAQLAVAKGIPSDAWDHLDAARTGASEETAARSELLRARLLRSEKPADSHACAVRAVETLRCLGQRDGVVAALTEAGEALRAAGRTTEADERFEEADTVLRELRLRVPLERREAFDGMAFVRELAQARQPAPVEGAEVSALEPDGPHLARGAATSSSTPPRTNRMVGASAPMLRVFGMIEKMSQCDAPTLILGESGTGKELVAEAICEGSARKGKPFVRVNAAAFAETLLESELFGHEKGAFTGAISRKLGAFEQADGGTLFLDEIGDISPKTQVSLLRVLQDGEFRRVGGRSPVCVDVRVICATNRNLDQMIKDGTFRLDLYYRIRGLTLELPPVRDRGDDLALLVDAILGDLAKKHGQSLTLCEDAVRLLGRYHWPGNVRELENVLRSVYFFAQGGQITADDLTTYTLLREVKMSSLSVAGVDAAPLEEGFNLNEAKRSLEIQCIEKALGQTGGNITQAAKLLGMKRPRLSQKIKEYRLSRRSREVR